MKENVSPEEKLLRLIRGQKKKDTAIEKKIESTITHTPRPLPEKLKKIPGLKSSLLSFVQRQVSILDTKKIIGIIFIFSCLYLIFSFLYPVIFLKKIKYPKAIKNNESVLVKEPRQEVKPFEFYLEGTKGRHLFGNPQGQALGGPVAVAGADLIKDISLVGIVSGENPQAIIEDKKAQKTYYVSKGQLFGDVQVEDIREGKIIVSYQGQRYELYL
jgi:type II secretory pathway component PulC